MEGLSNLLTTEIGLRLALKDDSTLSQAIRVLANACENEATGETLHQLQSAAQSLKAADQVRVDACCFALSQQPELRDKLKRLGV